MRLSTTLFALLLGAVGVAQVPLPWSSELSRTAMDDERLEVYLVEALNSPDPGREHRSPPPTGPMGGSGSGPRRDSRFSGHSTTAQFRILDAGPGAEAPPEFTGLLTSTYFLPRQEARWPVRKGRRYLVVAVAPQMGAFWFTSGRELALFIEIEAEPEVDRCVLLMLETDARELPEGLAGADLITSAILDTLAKPTDAKVHTVVKLLCTALPVQRLRPSALPSHQRRVIGWEDGVPVRQDLVPYSPEGPLVAKLRAKLDAAKTRYQTSKLLELLVRWRVPGHMKAYAKSLEHFLRNTSRYMAVEDNQLNYGLIRGLKSKYGELDGYFNYEVEEVLRLITSARNANVLLYWLTHFGGIMNESQLRRFGRLLDFPDPRVQYEVVSVLASQLKEPEKAPNGYVLGPEGNIPYPDLQEKVQYWKWRLGIR